MLLHGYPSSSFMFRELILALEDQLHLIAPDYPGFGNSDAPSPAQFAYTFDHLAQMVEEPLDDLGIQRFGIYIQDYGSGRHPDRDSPPRRHPGRDRPERQCV